MPGFSEESWGAICSVAFMKLETRRPVGKEAIGIIQLSVFPPGPNATQKSWAVQ